MTPKVSICIPAYNEAELLRRALDSIFVQKFLDFEVIVTDDSLDSTVEHLMGEYFDNSQLRYFKNVTPLGPPENWNSAIRLAQGDYIKLLHHDDWFATPESLGEFVEMLDKHPSVGFAFSGVAVQDVDRGLSRHHFATQRQLFLLRAEPACLFYGNFIGPPSATIVRRSAYVEYDKKLVWTVDISQYIEILKNTEFATTRNILICNSTGRPKQMTSLCIGDARLNLYEYFYLYEKIESNIIDSVRKKCISYLVEIIYKYGVYSEYEVRQAGFDGNLPKEVLSALGESNVAREWYLVKRRLLSKIKARLNLR